MSKFNKAPVTLALTAATALGALGIKSAVSSDTIRAERPQTTPDLTIPGMSPAPESAPADTLVYTDKIEPGDISQLEIAKDMLNSGQNPGTIVAAEDLAPYVKEVPTPGDRIVRDGQYQIGEQMIAQVPANIANGPQNPR